MVEKKNKMDLIKPKQEFPKIARKEFKKFFFSCHNHQPHIVHNGNSLYSYFKQIQPMC